MNRRQTVAGLLAMALSACALPPPAPTQLIGVWAPESAQLGGRALPVESFDGAMLKLDGQGYEFAGDRGRYALLRDGKEAAMDILGTEGPNQGRKLLAIYWLEADHLIICYELGAGTRPLNFESPPGSHRFLVSYRRVQ
jgi:uncharacterized protein (TIGR03067 family)